MLRGAAASLHAALASVDKDAGNLRRALRKSRRREQWRAAALVLPLFVFLAACFVVPIGAMLSHGVIDPDIVRILPTVTDALKSWDGHELPPESAYAALITDIRAAREAGTLASAATRLNYDVPGFRTLLEELRGPAFRAACEDKFGIDLSGRSTMITVRGRCGTRDGNIHTDSLSKIITVLIYLNPHWEQPGGRLRLLRSPRLQMRPA